MTEPRDPTFTELARLDLEVARLRAENERLVKSVARLKGTLLGAADHVASTAKWLADEGMTMSAEAERATAERWRKEAE